MTFPLSALPATTPTPKPEAPAAERDAALRQSAREFEAAFVRQMLQHAGLAEAFGAESGPMADAFSTFLLDHVAEQVIDDGGFGLADRFYQKLAGDDAVSTPAEVRRL